MLLLKEAESLELLRQFDGTTLSVLVQSLGKEQWERVMMKEQIASPMTSRSIIMSATSDPSQSNTAEKIPEKSIPFESLPLNISGPLVRINFGNSFGESGFVVDYNRHASYIFVAAVKLSSNAEAAGLMAGDMLISVNKRGMLSVSLGECRKFLNTCNEFEVVVLRPDPSTSVSTGVSIRNSRSCATQESCGDLIHVNLQRDASNNSLGMSIMGGDDYDLKGIFVARLSPDSPAAQGGVQVGDRVLEVNGQSLIGTNEAEAIAALRGTDENVSLVLQRVGTEQWAALCQKSKIHMDGTPIPRKTPSISSGTQRNTIAEVASPTAMSWTSKDGEVFAEYPPSLQQQSITVQRIEGSLGFSILGRTQRGRLGSAQASSSGGVFINSVTRPLVTGGPFPGHRILTINGVDVSRRAYEDVLAALSSSGDEVILDVIYEPEEFSVARRACEDEVQQDTPVSSPLWLPSQLLLFCFVLLFFPVCFVFLVHARTHILFLSLFLSLPLSFSLSLFLFALSLCSLFLFCHLYSLENLDPLFFFLRPLSVHARFSLSSLKSL